MAFEPLDDAQPQGFEPIEEPGAPDAEAPAFDPAPLVGSDPVEARRLVAEERRGENVARLGVLIESGLRRGDDQAGVVALKEQIGNEVPMDVLRANYPKLKLAAEAAKYDPARFADEQPELAALLLKRPEMASVAIKDGLFVQAAKMLALLGKGADRMRAAGLSPLSLDGPLGGDRPLERSVDTSSPEAAGASLNLPEMGDLAAQAKELGQERIEERQVSHLGKERPQGVAQTLGHGLATIAETAKEGARANEAADAAWDYGQAILSGADADTIQALDDKRLDAKHRAKAGQYHGEAGAGLQTALDVLNAGQSSAQTLVKGGPIVAGAALAAGVVAVASKGGAVGALKAAGAIIPTALPIAVTYGSFRSEFGSALNDFDDLRTDDGQPLDPATKLGAALIYAGVASLIETANEIGTGLASFGPIGKLVKSGDRAAFIKALQANPARKAMLREVLSAVGKSALGEGAEEGSQTLAQNVAGYLARSIQAGSFQEADVVGAAGDIGESSRAGFVGAAGTGGGHRLAGAAGEAGLRMTGHLTEAALERDANLSANARVGALHALRETETVKASPTFAAQFVEAETSKAGEKLTHIYVDAEAAKAYFQGEKAELLGEDGKIRLQEAILGGGKMPVPVAAFLSPKWDEAAKALAKDVTARAHYLTENQLAETDKAIESEAKELLKVFDADDAPPPETEAEGRFVDALTAQIRAVTKDVTVTRKGETKTEKRQKYTDDQIRQQVALERVGMRTLARRSRMDFAEIAEMAAIRVEQQGKPAVEVAPVAATRSAAPAEPQTPLAEAPASTAQTKAHLAPEDYARIQAGFLAGTSDAQKDALLRDRNTGLLHARAVEAILADPATAPTMVAEIDLEGFKKGNDEFGHEAPDAMLRYAAGIINGQTTWSAKVGGSLVFPVADAAEAERVRALVAARFADSKIGVTTAAASSVAGKLRETMDAVGAVHRPLKDKLEKEGARAARGQEPIGWKGDVKGFGKALEGFKAAPRVEGHAIPEAALKAHAGLTAEQASETAYLEESGLFTDDGWAAHRNVANPKPQVASADLRNLKALDNVEAFGRERTDAIVRLFSRLLADNGGLALNAAHPHGDEYFADSDDRGLLEETFDTLAELAEQVVIFRRVGNGEIVVQDGLHFAVGYGETFDEADRLNLKKAKALQGDVPKPQRLRGAEALAFLGRVAKSGKLVVDADGLVREDARRTDRSASGRGSAAGSMGPDVGEGAGAPGLARAAQGAVVSQAELLQTIAEIAAALPLAPSEKLPASVEASLLAGRAGTTIQTGADPEPARYEVIELDDLLPSHNPDTFQPAAGYPEGVQERVYHSEPAEKAKVLKGAKDFDPTRVLGNDPAATVGPPIVTDGEKRLVLGGNGRSMMMKLALRNDGAREAYRSELIARAAGLGQDPVKIRAMRAPVLVRVATTVKDSSGKEALQRAVRRYNTSQTQGMAPKAAAVADARMLTPESIATIAGLLAETEGTLREAMASKDGAMRLAGALRSAKIVTDTNQAEWLAGDELTDAAKDKIEGMFVGLIVETPERYAKTADSIIKKLERAVPHLLRVQGINPDLAETKTIREALDAFIEAAAGKQTVDHALRQLSILGPSLADKVSPAGRAMAQLLENLGQKAVAERFKEWAKHAAKDPKQGDMFSKPPTLASSRKVLFGEELGKAEKLFESAPGAPANESTARGWVEFARTQIGRMFRVVLTDKADLSTFLHESGHVFLELLGDLAERPDAPAALKADYAAALGYLGAANRAELETKHHEKWARSFEAYLFEGKAPSAELQRAFDRFKAWLKKIYKDVAKGLGVQLDDEIRGVFDRLLATDEEIEAARRAAGLKPIFRSANEAGMTPEEWQVYLDAQEAAQGHARRAADLTAMRGLLRQKDKEWKAQEKELRKEFAAKFAGTPGYRALRYIARGEVLDAAGEEFGRVPVVPLDRAAVARIAGEETAAKLDGTKNLTAGLGVDPDALAEVLGFENGFALIQALATLPSQAAWAQEQAAEEMKRLHPEAFQKREELRAEVQKGLHGDQTEAWFLAELRALNNRTSQGPGGVPTMAGVKRAGEMLVERKTVGELSLASVLNAERSEAEHAIRAAAKGDFGKALIHQQRRMLNHALYRAVVEAKEERERFEATAKRLQKKAARARFGKAGADLQESLDAVLEAVGLKATEEREDSLPDTSGIVAALEGVGATIGFDEDLLGKILGRPRELKDLTVAEMREAAQVVDSLDAAVTNATTHLLDGQRIEKAAAMAMLLGEWDKHAPDLGAHVGRYDKTAGEWIAGAFRAIEGETVRPEALLAKLGGEGIESATFRLLVKPLQEAKHRDADLLAEAVKPVVEAMGKLPKGRIYEKIDGAKLFAGHTPDFAPPRNRLGLLMMALNMGTESSRERLLDGRHITEQQVLAALDDEKVGLTDAEWQWVKAVWQAAESLWPLTKELERRDSGITPKKLALSPIVTRFGTLAGGYFPAVYEKAARVGKQQAGQDQSAIFDPSFIRPGTSHSHTKARAAHFNAVIALDPSIIHAHLAKVTHDIAFREAIKSTASLLLNEDVGRALERHLGEGKVELFRDWLRDVAQERGAGVAAQARVWQRFLGAMQGNTAVAVLGYGADIAAGDLSQFAVMATELGPTHVASALESISLHWPTTRAEALKKSGELRSRAQHTVHRLRELERKTFGRNPLEWRFFGTAREHAFDFMEATDALTATAFWVAAHRQAQATGKGEDFAVTFADEKVRRFFPAHSNLDKPEILRSKWTRSLLMFHGYFSTAFADNWRLAQEIGAAYREDGLSGVGQAKATARLTGKILARLTTQMVLSELLSGRGAEDDEDWAAWFLRKLIAAPFLLIPFGGILAGAFEAKVLGRRPSVRAAPAFAVLDQAVKTADRGGWEQAIRLLALLSGQPLIKPMKLVKAVAPAEE